MLYSSAGNSTWLNVVKFNPLVRLPEFLMGMCAGMLFLRNACPRKLATALVLAALLGITGVAWISPGIPYPLLHTGLLSGVFAALVYGLALGPSWTNLLKSRPLVVLGDASYSLYLLHNFVLTRMLGRDGNLVHTTMLWIVVAVAAAIALAIGVHEFVEEPLRHKFNPRRNQSKTTPTRQPEKSSLPYPASSVVGETSSSPASA
jgi:peptidoglycan/LPS O-acetylase OafA/YrhL